MIHGKVEPIQERDWCRTLREAVTDPAVLLRRLGLPASHAEPAACDFPLRVPEPYLARIRPGDPDDPLLRQVLPVAAELETAPGYAADPVGDLDAVCRPGLLQKYRGRVLAIATGACAIHCRFCFRRAFPYGEHAGIDAARLFAALRGRPDVDELILSGGDPLVLDDARLDGLLAGAERLPQLTRLRIHTRLPVVIPERVTPALCRRLADSRLRVVVVLHVNHPNELDDPVADAAARLAASGALLLNQAVLLRGVNDATDTLAALSLRLGDIGVLPYYLHALDRVTGTRHFAVDDGRARRLHRALLERLPGYLVPRLVREEAGAPSKTPLHDGGDASPNRVPW